MDKSTKPKQSVRSAGRGRRATARRPTQWAPDQMETGKEAELIAGASSLLSNSSAAYHPCP
jgi:hypothetical protein